ncbi:hypothetical protein BN7_5566 [Wickerhamomyces ciferrii]|uniref:HMG box domain-containing protein n=1 Tax=Wickerhamomyces ciferrii (strain ATCC 14091 / BCRC 22168 / CBS 111 / JCM 3599 / NBRC 0793 / NRRL Y-1031 F-60-10) TaxID=1206466 RepID=K0KWW6_WICCF|nr:uncharacterized protein BN7_5566 [Wickerhamomyces ciferrii]CCH45979.1 hypothetical protein BN7_5566 [Wickerhamomyces ciferrii]
MSAPRKTTKASRKKKGESLSAYMFFANDNRDIVRSENPGISFGGVGKLLGERWKALDDEGKKPYNAKAEADKKRYEEEKANYQAQQQDEE